MTGWTEAAGIRIGYGLMIAVSSDFMVRSNIKFTNASRPGRPSMGIRFADLMVAFEKMDQKEENSATQKHHHQGQ